MESPLLELADGDAITQQSAQTLGQDAGLESECSTEERQTYSIAMGE